MLLTINKQKIYLNSCSYNKQAILFLDMKHRGLLFVFFFLRLYCSQLSENLGLVFLTLSGRTLILPAVAWGRTILSVFQTPITFFNEMLQT